MKEAPLARILADRSYAYRDELARWPGAEALRASVRRRGILTPLRLRRAGDDYQVIAGFRRLELAAEELRPAVPFQLVEGEAFELFLSAVEEHAGQPSNLRERVRALRVGAALAGAGGDLEPLLLALGLQPSPRVAEQHLALCALPGELLDLLVDKGFSLRRCLPYGHLEPEEGRLLARVARQLGLGGRQLEQVCTWLLEVAAREALPLAAVVAELGDLDQLDQLEARRFPEATRRRLELTQICDGLREATGVALAFDRDLGAESVELSVTIRRPDDLEGVASSRVREAVARLIDGLRR